MAVWLLFVALHADEGHEGEGFSFDMGQERGRGLSGGGGDQGGANRG